MSRAKLFMVLFSLLNAGVMLLLTLGWLSLPRTFGDEAFFIKWIGLVKKRVLKIDPKPASETFVYIDVSRSKALVPVIDPLFEEDIDYNRIAITDRAQLAALLDTIRTHTTAVPLVLLDLHFPLPSVDDAALAGAIARFPYPLLAARPAGDTTALFTGLDRATGTYSSTDGVFLKYPLLDRNQRPTLPARAYELLTGKSVSATAPWVSIDRQRHYPSPVVDLRVRPVDLTGEAAIPVFGLGALLFQFEYWAPEDVRALFENRLIIVGDFHEDRHTTVYGTLPGPVVVHNALLTLQAGDTRLRVSWLVWLYALFVFISHRVYRAARTGLPNWFKSRSPGTVGRVMANSLDDSFFLILGTVVSILVFNVYINILVLLAYLWLLAFVLRHFVFRPYKTTP